MRKLSLIVLSGLMLGACTHTVYTNKGNATIVTSKNLSPETVELLVRKDNGEEIVMTRKYDSHATVGARVEVSDSYNHQDADLKTITRYEFK